MDRILIVDDDPDVLSGLELLLGGEYEILTARDGREALDVLGSVRVDMVVLDLYMPVLGGLDVLGSMRQKGMRVPVLLVSGRLDLLSRAGEMGADDHLAKPFRIEALEKKIAGLLAGRPKPAPNHPEASPGNDGEELDEAPN